MIYIKSYAMIIRFKNSKIEKLTLNIPIIGLTLEAYYFYEQCSIFINNQINNKY